MFKISRITINFPIMPSSEALGALKKQTSVAV